MKFICYPSLVSLSVFLASCAIAHLRVDYAAFKTLVDDI